MQGFLLGSINVPTFRLIICLLVEQRRKKKQTIVLFSDTHRLAVPLYKLFNILTSNFLTLRLGRLIPPTSIVVLRVKLINAFEHLNSALGRVHQLAPSLHLKNKVVLIIPAVLES